MTGRRGVATTEYMLLVSVIVVALVAGGFVLIPTFRDGVSDLAGDVASLLRGEGTGREAGEAAASASDCPYTFDPRTGRWHDDADGYLMVSFADAADAGCSR